MLVKLLSLPNRNDGLTGACIILHVMLENTDMDGLKTENLLDSI